MRKTLFIFGCGYSARLVAQNLVAQGWTVFGTTRSEDNFNDLLGFKIQPVLWDDVNKIKNILIRGCSLLTSIAPKSSRDEGLERLLEFLISTKANVDWLGYMSSTGVYGDRGGGWVNEESLLDTKTSQGQARVVAEKKWKDFAGQIDVPLFIFRIAGIYGPRRSIFDRLRAGKAQKIIKADQFFNRIHVEDIAGVISLALLNPKLSGVFNLSDDLPTAGCDVIDEATRIMNVEPLPQIDFSEADLTDMAKSFYSESKRVSNKKLVKILNYSLKHSTYLSGLQSIFTNESRY
jgi:nucleoside-diphosphate-sugar epimerase